MRVATQVHPFSPVCFCPSRAFCSRQSAKTHDKAPIVTTKRQSSRQSARTNDKAPQITTKPFSSRQSPRMHAAFTKTHAIDTNGALAGLQDARRCLRALFLVAHPFLEPPHHPISCRRSLFSPEQTSPIPPLLAPCVPSSILPIALVLFSRNSLLHLSHVLRALFQDANPASEPMSRPCPGGQKSADWALRLCSFEGLRFRHEGPSAGALCSFFRGPSGPIGRLFES
jgi:hypothetical protein